MGALVLGLMVLLSPKGDHVATARAIARAVEAAPPLFRDDDDRVKTAALVVAVAWRESNFRQDAKSATNDHCMMQVHARPDLADDADACVTTGLEMLRESMRACPAHPVATYAEGPSGCSSARAQRISRDRMALASWLARKVKR